MATGLLIAFILIIALLAIPLTLRFHITRDQVFNSDVQLTWAFGLVRVTLPSTEEEGTPEPTRGVTEREQGEMDTAELARRVYAEIRRRLSVEWERLRR